MPFDDLLDDLNGSCLEAFAQTVTLTRATGISESVEGILEEAAELEDVAPGDGSAYAILWLPTNDLDPVPEVQDEISTSSWIYKIMRIRLDGGGGMRLLLRQDRSVS